MELCDFSLHLMMALIYCWFTVFAPTKIDDCECLGHCSHYESVKNAILICNFHWNWITIAREIEQCSILLMRSTNKRFINASLIRIGIKCYKKKKDILGGGNWCVSHARASIESMCRRISFINIYDLFSRTWCHWCVSKNIKHTAQIIHQYAVKMLQFIR